MKLFFLKSFCILSAVTLTLFLFYKWRPRVIVSNDYLAEIRNKHERLENAPSPKLILVGGSNIAFGINTKELKRKLGMPVINMGLHAGLGLPFLLNEVKEDIKPNDIVVLSLEYFLQNGNPNLIDKTVALYPRASSYRDLPLLEKLQAGYEQFTKGLNKNVNHIQATLLRKKALQDTVPYDSLYNSKAFSKDGDMVNHFNRKPPLSLNGRYTMAAADYSSGIKKINHFIEYVQSKGGRFYFLFPPYPSSEIAKNKKVIDHYAQQFREQLKAPILNTPETFAYPDDYFFDTIYHLREKGTNERTDILVALLSKVIKK